MGVVLVLASAFLHVKISVKVFGIYLGVVTSFRARLCCDIPWYIYGSRGNPLSLISVVYLWATLGCVFSCHGILVWPVRGSLGAPSMKSVGHRAVCAEFSRSSDVKS